MAKTREKKGRSITNQKDKKKPEATKREVELIKERHRQVRAREIFDKAYRELDHVDFDVWEELGLDEDPLPRDYY